MDQPPPYLTWGWPADLHGSYDLMVRAFDLAGRANTSNRIHIAVGVQNVARGKPVCASSGDTPEAAVDGSYYSSWHAAKDAEDAWLEIDLQQPVAISQINLVWGWKIHPARFAVEVTSVGPDSDTRHWKTVYVAENLPWVTWKATHRVEFEPVNARFVRIHAFQRANRQTWSGYDLAEIEIPVNVER